MSWEDKPLKRQGHNSVPQRYNPVTDEWEVETTEADPVYDADVLAKIQELDDKVQGIIDGTTPANTLTSLTGSRVPDPITLVSDFSVLSNTTGIAVSTYEITDVSSFSVGISSDSGSPSVTVEVLPIVNGLISSTVGVEKIIDREVLNNNRGLSKQYTIKTSVFRLQITNHSDTDHLFDLHLYKSVSSPPSQLEKMEYYGATINERPSPIRVPVGSSYMAINTDEIWQSNGTEWLVK